MNSASVNLIAIGKSEEYTITLGLDGGKAQWTTKEYNIESKPIALPTPRKQGYTFAGGLVLELQNHKLLIVFQQDLQEIKHITANWAAAEINYKVVHYQQKVDGDPTKNTTPEEINANFEFLAGK